MKKLIAMVGLGLAVVGVHAARAADDAEDRAVHAKVDARLHELLLKTIARRNASEPRSP